MLLEIKLRKDVKKVVVPILSESNAASATTAAGLEQRPARGPGLGGPAGLLLQDGVDDPRLAAPGLLHTGDEQEPGWVESGALNVREDVLELLVLHQHPGQALHPGPGRLLQLARWLLLVSAALLLAARDSVLAGGGAGLAGAGLAGEEASA